MRNWIYEGTASIARDGDGVAVYRANGGGLLMALTASHPGVQAVLERMGAEVAVDLRINLYSDGTIETAEEA